MPNKIQMQQCLILLIGLILAPIILSAYLLVRSHSPAPPLQSFRVPKHLQHTANFLPDSPLSTRLAMLEEALRHTPFDQTIQQYFIDALQDSSKSSQPANNSQVSSIQPPLRPIPSSKQSSSPHIRQVPHSHLAPQEHTASAIGGKSHLFWNQAIQNKQQKTILPHPRQTW